MDLIRQLFLLRTSRYRQFMDLCQVIPFLDIVYINNIHHHHITEHITKHITKHNTEHIYIYIFLFHSFSQNICEYLFLPYCIISLIHHALSNVFL